MSDDGYVWEQVGPDTVRVGDVLRCRQWLERRELDRLEPPYLVVDQIVDQITAQHYTGTPAVNLAGVGITGTQYRTLADREAGLPATRYGSTSLQTVIWDPRAGGALLFDRIVRPVEDPALVEEMRRWAEQVTKD